MRKSERRAPGTISPGKVRQSFPLGPVVAHPFVHPRLLLRGTRDAVPYEGGGNRSVAGSWSLEEISVLTGSQLALFFWLSLVGAEPLRFSALVKIANVGTGPGYNVRKWSAHAPPRVSRLSPPRRSHSVHPRFGFLGAIIGGAHA